MNATPIAENNEQGLRVVVSVVSQTLQVILDGEITHVYPIATAKNGTGQIENSECTPLGLHRISEKIGDQVVENTVFIARQAQSELYTDALAKAQSNRDWILTRIIWLDGLEPGFNCGVSVVEKGLSCDTKSRYVYIHGCPDSHAMQIPSSHGCIKMRNTDVIELFEMVDIDTLVLIEA